VSGKNRNIELWNKKFSFYSFSNEHLFNFTKQTNFLFQFYCEEFNTTINNTNYLRMKKLNLIILILAVSLSGHSQILRSIVNSAKNQAINSAANKTSEKVNKEVDKSVNKAFDDATKEDSIKKSKEKPEKNSAGQGGGDQPPASMSKFMKSMGMSTEEVKHKDVYKFSGQILMVMQVTDSDGKKQEPAEYETRIDEATSDASFILKSKEGGNTTTIMDQENSCMLILTEKDGKKTGLASKFDINAKPATEEKPGATQKPEEECKFSKTGKSQNISGYNCSEYRCETTDAITSAWTTKDFSAKNNKLFGSNAMGKAYKTDGLDGMVIQYETHSKKDKSSSIMTIKSIDMKKSSSFSTAGYEISSFSFTGKK
jgi:hypothetical protein